MEYYFNELSIPEETDKHTILQQIRGFVTTCRDLKKIEFGTLRADRNIRHIEINGKLVVEWLKNETDLRRRLTAFDSKFPYIGEDDIDKEKIGWQIISYQGSEGVGLCVAHLKNSLVVSFPSNDDWKQPEVEVQHEFLSSHNNKINTENIIIKNASLTQHCEDNKPFAIEKLKEMPVPQDWRPEKKYLPRVKLSNKLLNIDTFYENSNVKTIADFREVGKDVAELNFYKENEYLSKINTTNTKIRDIYESKNISGKTIYLSVDVEKGAFEVCDEKGTHQEEILFSEKHSSGQKLDHSIKLKK